MLAVKKCLKPEYENLAFYKLNPIDVQFCYTCINFNIQIHKE